MMQADFNGGVRAYEDYLRSPLGRLRDELVWQQLAPLLDRSPLRILDAGSGLGGLASRLARLGHTVTLVDAAPEMAVRAKDIAAADAPTVQARLTYVVADVHHLPPALTAQLYDVVICHNVLEYSPDPPQLLAHLAALLTDGGALSLLVANQANPPLQAAIKGLDLAAAHQQLTTDVQPAAMFGAAKRVFTVDALINLCADAGISTLVIRPIRVVADLLPNAVLTDPAQQPALLALETALSQRREYRDIGRMTWAWGTRIHPAAWAE